MNQGWRVNGPSRGRWVIRSVSVTAIAWAGMELLSPLLDAMGDDPSRLSQLSPIGAAGAVAAVLASVLALTGFVVTALLLIFWEYRTIQAANALGIPTELAPVESVLWWFVPFANLWKPYTVMRSLGTCLAPGLTRNIAVWWASELLTTASVYLSNAGGVAAQVARFGGSVTVLVSAVMLARIVRGIQNGLDAAAARNEERVVAAARVVS